MYNSRRVLILLFVTVILVCIAGAYFKITNAGFADLIMEAALCTFAVFIVLVIRDIVRSTAMDNSEKWMYSLAVIFMPLIGGLLYFLRPQRKHFSNRFDDFGKS